MAVVVVAMEEEAAVAMERGEGGLVAIGWVGWVQTYAQSNGTFLNFRFLKRISFE